MIDYHKVTKNISINLLIFNYLRAFITTFFIHFKTASKIGNDVWIGQNVFMTGGLTIGDGAVILAGAVVTKNIPPYAIAGGVPCVIKGYRYDEATIAVLLEMKWWNQPLGWLMEHWELMNDIGQLLSYYHNHSGEFNKQY